MLESPSYDITLAHDADYSDEHEVLQLSFVLQIIIMLIR